MFHDDISKLVAETLDHAEVNVGQTNKDFLFEEQNSISLSKKMVPNKIPDEVPGFFYHLEKKPSTFVLRILESENLKKEYFQILDEPSRYSELRLEGEDLDPTVELLHFFECDTITIARAVKKQLSNKRFPIFEEHVLNISDPSDSWWVNCEDNDLTIYFKLSRTVQMENLMKIGPMGDSDIATKTLFKFQLAFSKLFPLAHFSCAHGQFNISCYEETNIYFKEFVKLFKNGHVGHEFWVKMWNLEFQEQDPVLRAQIQEAIYYLMELSVMRRFWSKIQKELTD